ncbi:type IV secretion system protein TraC [Methylomonas sp. UP202]|uniref:type IV secretion system protein TraC n=1 Tax=Methylomonas sp. UP202 TaxID=3040943 RepID=UPI002479E9B5|nr:type IV secretion system protein TraC [Methylomonas sp. UP202]WGS88655.1 type IV secretion system protein TraC [Methylomonas sp. UP202]
MPKLDYHRIDQLFSILAFDPDTQLFLGEDRSLSFGFLCEPLFGNDPSIADRINVLLNQEWPIDSLLQISLWASPDIDTILAALKTRRLEQQNPLYQALVSSNVDYLRGATQHAIDVALATRVRRFHVLVTAKLPLAGAKPNVKEMKQATELRLASSQALATIGLRPKTLTADVYVRLLNTLLNWQPEASWHDLVVPECDPRKLIREQLFDFDNELAVDVTGVTLGNKRVKTLSVKRFPDQIYFGSALSYLGDLLSGARGIRDNVLLTVTLHYPDSEATRMKLETKRQFTANQAVGPLLTLVPQLAVRKHHFDLLFEALNDGDRPIRAYFGMVLFCDPQEESQAVANARTYYRELGFQLLEDRYFCLPYFLNCLPLGAELRQVQVSNRYITLATRHAIPLLPLFADWAGTGSPVLNFVSRGGQLVNVSLFDSGSNFNCCIAAQSGSGKSFLTNELIVNYLTEGAQIWVIDVGRSYQNLADTLDGEFMEFTADKQICLNPFELVRSWEDEADVVAGLVTAMAAPTEKLSDFQTAGLKRVLKGLWDEKAQAMTVDDIAQRLRAEADQRLMDVGEQLFPFTLAGEYGRFFNGRNNVRFENSFTVLELEELKGRKHLQQVVLLQLIYQIQQEMYLGERDRRKIVIIDESWDLLSMGDAATFIEHGYRRFRKYGGAAVTITQSVNDLYRSPTGRAIVENSANMYLLGQKAEALEAIRAENRLPISDGAFQLLKSVHTIPGVYSEIFFITEYGQGIARLVVDPYKRLLYSTKAEHVNAIKNLKRQGLTTDAAIRQLLQPPEIRHVA